LINRVNSPSHLGKCIATPSEWAGAVFESNMMRMQISSLVSIDWLMNYLHSNDGRALLIVNAKWAVNQASINQEDVKSCPIPLPPFAEQVRASELASRNLAASARAIAVSELQEIRSSGLRQSILSAAFTGQLVAQDPTDEPASALLARIRAERSASSKPSPARRTRKEPTNA
jgi:type I restriction enzyme S subunit